MHRISLVRKHGVRGWQGMAGTKPISMARTRTLVAGNQNYSNWVTATAATSTTTSNTNFTRSTSRINSEAAGNIFHIKNSIRCTDINRNSNRENRWKLYDYQSQCYSSTSKSGNNNDNQSNNNMNNGNNPDSFRFVEEKRGTNTIKGRSISADKIISISQNLDSIPIGTGTSTSTLKDVHIREACQVLNSMAHLHIVSSDQNTWNEKINGEYAWRILKRILNEKGSEEIQSRNENKDNEDKDVDNIKIKFSSLIGGMEQSQSQQQQQQQNNNINMINSKVFHDTIKCMTKSGDLKLINQADDILHQLEEYYIETKCNIIHPVGRSYALLLDSIKYINYENNINADDNVNQDSDNDNYNGKELVMKIKRIMERIKTQQAAGNIHVAINSHLYNSALNTLTILQQSKGSSLSGLGGAGSNVNSRRQEEYHNLYASQLVQEMISDPDAHLDHVSYSIAIKSLLSSPNCWSQTRVEADASNSTDEDSTVTTGADADTSTDTATSISTGLTTSTTAKAIENIFLQMQNRGLGNPNQKTMTPILHSLSKDGNTDEISNLLQWMEEMYTTWGWEDIRPNNYHFNTMITALARKGSDGKIRAGSGHVAIEILNKMKTMYEDGGNPNVRPDLVTYNAVLHAISKEENSQGTRKVNSDIGERAEALLRRMEDGEEGEHISPDIFSFNAVLSALMNSATRDAAIKAQQMLERMSEKDVEPDLMSYTICINTLSKSRAKGSAQKAEDLLRVLEEAYANGREDLKPDVKCYNSVIHSWANSREDGGIQRAHQILSEMQSLRKSGERPDLIPDAISFTSIISALAHNSRYGKVKDAQKMLDAMFGIIKNEDGQGIKLDRVAYNALINAQSKQSGSAHKAEMLLDYMLEQDDTSAIRPNVITFNTVLDAISKSKGKGVAARAENILNKMQQMYEQGCKDVRPDTFSFASVLNAHANSGERGAAEKAETILKHMQRLHEDGNENVKPNTICFATVIKAYSRSRYYGAPQKAEDILRWMFEIHEGGSTEVKPNTIAFTSVCDAWSKSKADDATQRVESLIEWMKELSANGYKDVYPNEYTYNCLLTAIARSKDPDKATKAVQVLRCIQSDGRLAANIFNYNNILSACAYTHGSPSQRFNAIKIAVGTLEEAIAQSGSDDRRQITYGIFLQACANLTLNEAEKAKIEKIVETVFQNCCDQGLVDIKLVAQLRRASTQQLYIKLLGGLKGFPRIEARDIPHEWKANIKQRRAR